MACGCDDSGCVVGKPPLTELGKSSSSLGRNAHAAERNGILEAQAGKPAPRQMHAQFLHQFAFAGDAAPLRLSVLLLVGM
jgi:hypothetical protein